MSLYLSAGHIVTAFTQTAVLLFYNEYLGKKLKRKSFSVQVMTVQTILTLMVWMIFSLVSMYSANQEIDRFIDGVYFAFLTISTVGFGDFSYSSERAFNTNPLIWVIHAVLFCIGTGAIASVIGSMNELIANGNIKIPSCLRQNKEEVIGLEQMFARTQSKLITIGLPSPKSIEPAESNKDNEDILSYETAQEVIPKDTNVKEQENSDINQPSDFGVPNSNFVEESEDDNNLNHKDEQNNDKDLTDDTTICIDSSQLYFCSCQDGKHSSSSSQQKLQVSVATQTEPSQTQQDRTALQNNPNVKIIVKTSPNKSCHKVTNKLNNIDCDTIHNGAV